MHSWVRAWPDDTNVVRRSRENGDSGDFPVWELSCVREDREAMVAPGVSGVSVRHSENLDKRKDGEVWRR